MSRRLLLISGAAGAGKTTAARALASETGAGWLQVDTLWIAAQDAVGPESELYRTLRIDQLIRDSDLPFDELVRCQEEASQLVCRMLPRALRIELQTHEVLVADGAWLLPGFASSLAIEGVEVRAAVIHEAYAEEVRLAMDSRREIPMVAPWHERSARASWAYGNFLAEEASRVGVPVVAARSRETLLSRLRTALNV